VSPRARFVTVGVVLAALFYIVLRLYASSWLALWAFGDATAAIAVMLAAQGVPWKRKLLFSGATAALSVVIFEVVAHSFLGVAADVLTSTVVGATDWQLVSFVVVQVLFLGVPVAALALFVGRRPSALWTASTSTAPMAKTHAKSKQQGR
jgi:hypothetical protein